MSMSLLSGTKKTIFKFSAQGLGVNIENLLPILVNYSCTASGVLFARRRYSTCLGKRLKFWCSQKCENAEFILVIWWLRGVLGAGVPIIPTLKLGVSEISSRLTRGSATTKLDAVIRLLSWCLDHWLMGGISSKAIGLAVIGRQGVYGTNQYFWSELLS